MWSRQLALRGGFGSESAKGRSPFSPFPRSDSDSLPVHNVMQE